MASLGTSFSFGSAVSATGSAFSDAFESYRRTQYLVAGSNVAPTSETEEDEDEETGFRRGPLYDSDEEEAEDLIPGPASSRHRQDSFVANLDWDEEGEGEPSQTDLSFSPTSRPRLSGRRFDTGATVQQPTVARPGEVKPPMHEAPRNESSPLLSRKSSSVQEYFSVEDSAAKSYGTESLHDPNLLSPPAPTLRRRSSAASHKSKLQQYSFGGRSTYGQSLFNSIAILLGIGMLSEPLAFAYAGWGMGTVLIITYAMISCYTAKILARVILSDPRLRSYADIGRKAFGPKATVFISAMFCLELFAVTVVLVTLYADSLHSLIPTYSPTVYKIMGLAIFIPTVFLPLSLLSYTSILGILSTVILVFVIFVDGFSKTSAPGSLWEPASTTFGVQSFNKLGLAFGLFMAGFSGHPVIPSLARDMADPSQFDHMINWAFTIATFIYTAIGAAGYLMFGDAVHDEISIDLLNTPGYPPALNYICLWLLVISPLSKFGLNTQPLTTTIDVFLGLDTPSFASPEDLAAKPGRLSISRHGLKRALAVMQRICITLLSVGVSILIPEFSSMMAFLGSFSAFMLAVVGPVLANIALTGRCSLVDGSIVFMGIVMALWGTAAAFYAAA